MHKMDPGRAFDTISKILFVKMYVERSGRHGTFRVEYLDRRARERMPNEPLVHDRLFDLTKDYYKAEDLFRWMQDCSHSSTPINPLVSCHPDSVIGSGFRPLPASLQSHRVPTTDSTRRAGLAMQRRQLCGPCQPRLAPDAAAHTFVACTFNPSVQSYMP
ncbi:MAG: hypothetical protein OXI15_19475 [Chromatiales bacterium]|nr:hypothetical protein [Chromatiales bacterium]